MSSAVIVVERTTQYVNAVRAIDIFVDGRKVGFVKDGERKEFGVKAGEVRVQAKIDWCATVPVKVELGEGEGAEFELGSPLAGWRVMLALFYVLLNPRGYLYLRRR
jgi:hypothetical protein